MEYLVQPWKHQLEGINRASMRALEHGQGFGFFFEMGAGKTLTMINTLRVIGNTQKKLPRTLIFCPPIVVNNWLAEFKKHSKIASITPLVGPGRKRLELFKEKNSSNGHVFVMNYQSLLMEDLLKELKIWNPEVVIFDESHYLKSPKSKTSLMAECLVNNRMRLEGPKYNQKLVGPRPLVYLLSGSPILNSAMDIFMQYKILDAGETFGTNYFAFQRRYFYDKNAGMPSSRHFPDWQPQPGSLEKIAELMEPSSMRVLKKDCLDLPPLIRQVISVPMEPEQRRLYDSMLQDYVAFFKRGEQEHATSAVLAITKGLRLMQIASGYIKTVDDRELPVVEGRTPKQEVLKELLAELTPNHKVLVWAVWKQNYEQIREVLKELKIEYVEVHGEVSDAARNEALERLENDDKVRVLLGHPVSGGIGANMVAASYSIFYSRNFSLGQDIQAEARNYRGGSERHEKVTRIDLVSENSIEEIITEKLANKEEVSAQVLKEITYKIS